MDNNFSLYLGDCVDVLRGFEDGSVDAIVTDPPYGLTQNKKGGTGEKSINLNSPAGRSRISTGHGAGGFMGKKWDSDVPSVEIWAECLRVLKPGGNLLCFAGTRTQHRMVARIAESGFTLQDIVLWSYGSGFPKSHNISKAIDNMAGVKRELRVNERWADKYPNGPGGNLSGDGRSEHYGQAKRIVGNPIMTSDPVSDAAKQWEGWGTALKPSFEPVSIYTKGDSFTLHNEFKRLYYCAKASKKERNLGLVDRVSTHPTVKPLKLMENLCELATPPGGTILDPFMGSGTTGIASLNLGFNFIGIDMVDEYFDIAQLRLSTLFPQDQ